MADCIAIQQECIVAGKATRAKIVSQYKGDCIVTGRSWALGWGAGRNRHAQGAAGRAQVDMAGSRVRGAQAGVRGRAGRCTGYRQARGSSARARSVQAGERQARRARGRAAGAQGERPGRGWALGARPGRGWALGAAWARGLALGFALGLFSIRFSTRYFS